MKRLSKLLLALVILLIGIRVALPYVIKWKINQTLAESPDYGGHVEDVSLGVIRGIIKIDGIFLQDQVSDAIARMKSLRVDWQWLPLLHKQAVAGVIIDQLRVEAIYPHAVEETKRAAATKPKPPKTGKPLATALREQLPFKLYSFRLLDGAVQIKDEQAVPPTTLRIDDIQFSLENLTNSSKLSDTLFAKATLTALVMKEGTFDLGVRFNPVATPPAFDLKAEIKKVNLPDFNPLIRDKFKIVITSGTFDMVTEDAAAKGAFKGYVKPIISQLNVKHTQDASFGKKAATIAIKVANAVFSSSDEKLGTRIPVEGRLDDPNIGIVNAVINVLRNALTSAFGPTLEGSITLGNVQANATEIKKGSKTKERK